MTIGPVLEGGYEHAALEQTILKCLKAPQVGEMEKWSNELSARPPNPNSKPDTHVIAGESLYVQIAF